ncbi:MAG: hypothetical protein ACE5JX_09875 [Acidobacteriota bacterium]
MSAADLVSVINMALLLLILGRACQSGQLRSYPLFYSYLAYVLAVNLTNLLTAYLCGVRSPIYRNVYHLTTLPLHLFQLALLIFLHQALEKTSSSRSIVKPGLLCGILTLPVVVSCWQTDWDIYYKLHAVTLPAQVCACILLNCRLVARRELRVGRNLRGMLGGISLMVGLQAVNFVSFLFRDVPFGIFQILVPGIYSLALGILAYSMWSYEPLREEPEGLRLGILNQRLVQVIKSLLVGAGD